MSLVRPNQRREAVVKISYDSGSDDDGDVESGCEDESARGDLELSPFGPLATPELVIVDSSEGRGQYELVDENQELNNEGPNEPDLNSIMEVEQGLENTTEIPEIDVDEQEGVQVRPLGYIKDPATRRKRFCARKKTLLEKAKEIHIMCGATVTLELKAETGRVYTYHSHPVMKRSVKFQVGTCQLPSRESQRPAHHTPTKNSRLLPGGKAGPSPTPSGTARSPDVQELPAKKKRAKSKKAKERPSRNKCRVCKTTYKSKKDKNLKEKKGKQASWLGCDIPACNYWAHACCLNIKLGPKQTARKIPFKCSEHK
ncbi:uncharacterized protein [Diadema setosum]|uniref:uncharacterized protein isoform X1 n=1 Tax=Diadema setosum TaxID=31175 RepID=UPI003B3BE18A